jgi:glycine cleavage system transcriptional repressor
MPNCNYKGKGPFFMRRNIVLTLTGKDRVGIVDDVTELLLGVSGNIETSRMARLGGEFAILMLVSLPTQQLPNLDKVTGALIDQGFKVTTIQTDHTHAETYPGWLSYHIDISGADHEGVLHQIARHLSQRGIAIEELESGTTRAPISGTPLFKLAVRVAVPPNLNAQEWIATLEDVGQRLNADIRVSAVTEK